MPPPRTRTSRCPPSASSLSISSASATASHVPLAGRARAPSPAPPPAPALGPLLTHPAPLRHRQRRLHRRPCRRQLAVLAQGTKKLALLAVRSRKLRAIPRGAGDSAHPQAEGREDHP